MVVLYFLEKNNVRSGKVFIFFKNIAYGFCVFPEMHVISSNPYVYFFHNAPLMPKSIPCVTKKVHVLHYSFTNWPIKKQFTETRKTHSRTNPNPALSIIPS